MEQQPTNNSFKVDYSDPRQLMRDSRVLGEGDALANLKIFEKTSPEQRIDFQKITTLLIEELRSSCRPDLLSLFISEYNLTSEEGLSLMTLVEAFLRVPDNETRDKLFFDKVASKHWSEHLGRSKSSMVNLATIALSIADKMIDYGHNDTIRKRIKQALEILSRPSVRFSANNVMRFFAKQFVFAESIETVFKDSSNKGLYSFDMLGEAAWTMQDANKYFLSYKKALIEIGRHNQKDNIVEADGISVKLSALHPKYDFMHRNRVILELAPRVLELVKLAKKYNIGINIDAEEAERLDISLDVIEFVMRDIASTNWQGFGVVVQAYQKRAPSLIDWLKHNCKKYHLKIMVRLVKGAYWDSEIKKAQVMGDSDYPVYTKKLNTDYSYLVCAQKLLDMRDLIYPQFASHNAHSLVSVCEIAGNNDGYEVQRLHGMGESLHKIITSRYGILSRVYAPVGSHKELLAYLMRRLLENGANSSFINHLFDESIKPETLAKDVFSQVEKDDTKSHTKIPLPKDIYKSIRQNSKGILLSEQNEVDLLYKNQEHWLKNEWQAQSIIDSNNLGEFNQQNDTHNPADTSDKVGSTIYASKVQLDECLSRAKNAFNGKPNNQGQILKSLDRAANLYEKNKYELMVLAMREAGKTYQDAVDEVREAVDFLRYYAAISPKVMPGSREALGVFVCISPWNFPLAIFTGQVAAALAAGNVVIAKPAESTSLIAYRASQLLLEAGIPLGTYQLCLGKGSEVGSYLASSPLISGVAFTGSTKVAKLIKRNLVKNGNPEARVIAETGGLNAMVVDSTALNEQVARDVMDSAFKSAGQRCSALRILLIQDECFEDIFSIIRGSMSELEVGNPKSLSTDCGPVISADAQLKLQNYIDQSRKENQVIGGMQSESCDGYYINPTIIQLDDIDKINEEFFGPILHVIRYKSDNLINLINSLNVKGYGLTFGIHSRIKKQVDEVISKVNAGNIYVNRNQVGAIVGSQPFGGEGLSGTGPKAGGINALHGYSRSLNYEETSDQVLKLYEHAEVNSLIASEIFFSQDLLTRLQEEFTSIEKNFFQFLNQTINTYTSSHNLPGPTGESNTLSYKPKGSALCLGPTTSDALKQTILAMALGNSTISLITQKDYDSLISLGFSEKSISRLIIGPSLNLIASNQYEVILYFGDLMSVEKILEGRRKEIIPIMSSIYEPWQLIKEQVITIDTTASGGNANLLAL